MKHRRLLIGSIIAITLGIILLIIGPVVAAAGVSSHFEGWWIFGKTVTDVTTTYWIGVTLSLAGLIIIIIGIVGIILAFVLEVLDKSQKPMTPTGKT